MNNSAFALPESAASIPRSEPAGGCYLILSVFQNLYDHLSSCQVTPFVSWCEQVSPGQEVMVSFPSNDTDRNNKTLTGLLNHLHSVQNCRERIVLDGICRVECVRIF